MTKSRTVAHFRRRRRRKFRSVAHFWAQKWAFLTFCGAEGAARKFLNFKGPKNALKPDFRGFVQWPTFGFSEIVQWPNPRSPPLNSIPECNSSPGFFLSILIDSLSSFANQIQFQIIYYQRYITYCIKVILFLIA